MTAKSTLHLRPQKGLLQDASKLTACLKQFGEVQDVWVPESGYYGFATFKDPGVAKNVVSSSPHKLGDLEITFSFKRTKDTHGESLNRDAKDCLEPLFEDAEQIEQYSWKSYLAPARLKSDLECIGEELDPEHLERVKKSRQACMGDESVSSPAVPLVVFYGPPGTGKTFAMKIISAQSKLEPFVLNTSKVRKDVYSAPKIWSSVLDNISSMKNAAILVDEAEIVLGRRSVMADSASVAVKAHQEMLEFFLQWVEGLKTKKTSIVVIMATNHLDDIDEAILSRAKTKIRFELPDSAQCGQWWKDQGACHLAQSRFGALEFIVLGRLSSLAHLSFRELSAIAERMVQLDAQRQKTSGAAGQVRFSEYAMEIVRQARSNVSALAFKVLRNTQSGLWTATSILVLLDRFGRFVPRARL